MNTPHDLLVKSIFSQTEHARGLVRAMLPGTLAERLDLGTLALRPGHFSDAARELRTDLLFSAKTSGGADALVYLLFEHKSAVDPLLPVQLLRYQATIWKAWLDRFPRARTVPPIIPLVLYHGTRRWTRPTRFQHAVEWPFESKEELRFVPDFEIPLWNISAEDDTILRDRVMTAIAQLTLLSLKHAPVDADLPGKLLEWAGLFHEALAAPRGLEAVETLMGYIWRVTPGDRDEVTAAAARVSKNVEDATMGRAYDQLMEEGQVRGRVQMLTSQLKEKFGLLSESVRSRVSEASSEELDRWARRILHASTLEDVFDRGEV